MQILLDFRREYCIYHIQREKPRNYNYALTLHPTRTLWHPRRNGPNRPHDPRPRQPTDLSGQTRRPDCHPRPQGPYFLLQRRENGKNNCQRVGAEELEAIIAGVEGHARFQELAERYANLTEQLTWDQQSAGVKKKFQRFWRPSSRRRRSV